MENYDEKITNSDLMCSGLLDALDAHWILIFNASQAEQASSLVSVSVELVTKPSAIAIT